MRLWWFCISFDIVTQLNWVDELNKNVPLNWYLIDILMKLSFNVTLIWISPSYLAWNLKYLPENVKVERCGGECKHQNCIPSQIEIVRVPVYVNISINDDRWRLLTAYSGLQFLQSRSCGTVEVEEHKECKCGCLPKQCGPMHVGCRFAQINSIGNSRVIFWLKSARDTDVIIVLPS